MSERIGAYRSRYQSTKQTAVGGSNLVVDNVAMDHAGWVKSIGMHLGSLSGTGTADFRLVAYLQGQRVIQSGPRNMPATPAERTFDLDYPGLAVKNGDVLKVGVWVDPNDAIEYSSLGTGTHGRYKVTGTEAPESFTFGTFVGDEQAAVWLDYVPNQAPERGEWFGLTPTGQTGDFNPTFQGRLNHPDGRDHSTRVWVRIFDETDGKVVYEEYFTPTSQEIAAGRFSRQFVTHIEGHAYRATYRHRDTFNWWGDNAPFTHYIADRAPNRPVLSQPTGKKDFFRPNVVGTYSHPGGLSLDKARVRLLGATGDNVIETGEWVDVPNGATFTLTQLGGVDPLEPGNHRQVQAQTMDSAGGVSGWSTAIAFRIDEAPNEPRQLSPAEGQRVGTAVLTARVTDNDEDDMPVEEVRFWVYLDGELAPGWPALGRVGTVTGRQAQLNASQWLVLGEVYTWKCRSNDGWLDSPDSDEEEFYYATEPLLEAIFPDSVRPINGVWPPTAQWSNALTGITLGGSATGQNKATFYDTTAYSNGPVWRITKQGTNATQVLEWDSRFPCQPDQKLFLGVFLKDDPTDGPVAAVTPRIACYNSSGALISTINTDTGTIEVTGSWKYDGALGQSVTPAGTAFVAPQIQVPAGERGSYFVDLMMLVKVDRDAPVANDFAENYRAWYGPFKGNSPGVQGLEDYYWDGAGNGQSASHGVWNLTRPKARFRFRYSHLPGVDIWKKRIVLEKYDGTKFRPIYNSGPILYSNHPQQYFDLPTDRMKNRSRYRIRAHAWDYNGAEGDTGWVEFDTDFFGPAEVDLDVENCYADDLRAELVLSWEDPVGSESDNYVGVELSVDNTEEGEIVHELIRDPDVRQGVYYWPVSGREYLCKIRRVVLRDGERVESRWSTVRLTPDYFPRYFLKDVTKPRTAVVSWVPKKGEVPAITANAPIDTYLPIFIPEGGGPMSGSPLHFDGANRWRSGSFTASMEEDRGWHIPEEVQLQRAMMIEQGQRTCGFLGHVQFGKRFVTITGFGISLADNDEPIIEVEWEDTRYEEDIQLREWDED